VKIHTKKHDKNQFSRRNSPTHLHVSFTFDCFKLLGHVPIENNQSSTVLNSLANSLHDLVIESERFMQDLKTHLCFTYLLTYLLQKLLVIN